MSHHQDLLIIKKSDVENLGKKAMKSAYEVFQLDSHIYEIADEILQKERDNFYNYLVFFESFEHNPYDKEIYDRYKKYYLKEIEEKILNETLDIDVIFKVLSKIDFIREMDFDAYCERKAFLNIYSVFFNDYRELELKEKIKSESELELKD